MSGRNRRGRDVMGVGLAALNRLAELDVIDKLKLRQPLERAVYRGAKVGFRSVGVANRTFAKSPGGGAPQRPTTSGERGLFDLTPTDEQKMIVEATREFAAEQLRPVAAEADEQCLAPETILKRSVTELGVTLVGVPEALGGMGAERSATTGVLVAEALAHGDMGLAVACLAPAAVGNALVLWGNQPSSPPTCPPSSAMTCRLLPSPCWSLARCSILSCSRRRRRGRAVASFWTA